MSRPKKYLQICSEIRRRIREEVYTDRLPGRRELMAEFQISSRTMHKVFDELRLQGIIEPTFSGTLLKSSAGKNAARDVQILLLAPNEQDFDAVDHICMRIKELASIDMVRIIPFVRKNQSPAIDEILSAAAPEGCDGVIFTSSTYTSADAAVLNKRKIPFVSGNRPKSGDTINWVDWNHLELFDDMLGEAVSRGARYIDYFAPQMYSGKPADNLSLTWEDFKAAKRSYMLYNPELDDRDMELSIDIPKYAEFLSKLKHLPDIIWMPECFKEPLAAELCKYDLDLTNRMISIGAKAENGECNQVIYTGKAWRLLAEKIWKLMQFVRHHPDAPPRGIKQRCEVKFTKELKKIKINH